jgi:radical SAM protein with 4Fe4S-binding SPASM domain
VRPVVSCGRATRSTCPTPEQVSDAVRRVLAKNDEQVIFGSSCFEYANGGLGRPQAGCFNKHLHVDARANIIPCGYVKLPLGNLARNRLTDVFHGPRLTALRDLLPATICRTCEYFQQCRGGCRACATGWGFAAGEPDVYCPVSRSVSRHTYFSGAEGEYKIAYQPPGRIEIESSRTGDVVVFGPGGAWHSVGQVPAPGSVGLENQGAVVASNSGSCFIERIDEAGESASAGECPPTLVDISGFRICHLGRLGRQLSSETIAVLKPLDVIVGIYGGSEAAALGQKTIQDSMRSLGARILIPIPIHPDVHKSIECSLLLQSQRKVHRFSHVARVDLNTLPEDPEVWLFWNRPGTA